LNDISQDEVGNRRDGRSSSSRDQARGRRGECACHCCLIRTRLLTLILLNTTQQTQPPQPPNATATTTVNTNTTDIILPTYHIKPQENQRFSTSKATTIANDILQTKLKGKVDEKLVEEWSDFGDEFESLSKDIADKIKEECKSSMNIPRYKIIVQVTIGQMKDQGVKITSRSLWDTSTDNYATVCFQNEHIWASAIVFGLYTD